MAPYRALEEHLPQRTKRVLETLLRLHRANESLCLSFDAIATAAGVPRGTAVTAMEKLADLGVITIHGRRRKRTGVQECNAYKINPPPFLPPKSQRERALDRAAARRRQSAEDHLREVSTPWASAPSCTRPGFASTTGTGNSKDISSDAMMSPTARPSGMRAPHTRGSQRDKAPGRSFC
jgi:hypothetical protein